MCNVPDIHCSNAPRQCNLLQRDQCHGNHFVTYINTAPLLFTSVPPNLHVPACGRTRYCLLSQLIVPSVVSACGVCLLVTWIVFFGETFSLCVLIGSYAIIQWFDWTSWLIIVDPTPICQAAAMGGPRWSSTEHLPSSGPIGGTPGHSPCPPQVVYWRDAFKL